MEDRKVNFYVNNEQKTSYLGRDYLQYDFRIYEVPFPIIQTEGEHNLKSCDGCKKSHQGLLEHVKGMLKDFPDCCKFHKGLNDLKEFKKSDFKGVDKQVADKIFFVYHHIINHLESEDWYVNITDYIEYAQESFGKMPKDCGEPFQYSRFITTLQDLLEGFSNEYSGELDLVLAKTRVNKIKGFLIPLNEKNINEDFDLNVLLGTYEKWYNLFPFDLSYFEHLQQKFKNIIPIQKGTGHYNKYLKNTKIEVHTKESLSVVLLEITHNILQSINGLVLLEKGELNNADKIALELLKENRKLELKELSLLPNQSKQDFIKVLKSWFKGEKTFIRELKPILERADNKKQANLNRPNRTDIAYFAHYTFKAKSLDIKNEFPSVKAWNEIGEIYNKSGKNVQQMYNLISNNSEERLKGSKKINIEYVIESMLNDHPKAKDLAKDELKLVEINS